MSLKAENDLYLVFLDSEIVNKAQLVQDFKTQYPQLLHPCLLEYSSNSGPKSFLATLQTGISPEKTEENNQLLKRTHYDAGTREMMKQMNEEVKEEGPDEAKVRICGSVFRCKPEYKSRVVLLAKEVTEALGSYLGGNTEVLFAHYLLGTAQDPVLVGTTPTGSQLPPQPEVKKPKPVFPHKQGPPKPLISAKSAAASEEMKTPTLVPPKPQPPTFQKSGSNPPLLKKPPGFNPPKPSENFPKPSVSQRFPPSPVPPKPTPPSTKGPTDPGSWKPPSPPVPSPPSQVPTNKNQQYVDTILPDLAKVITEFIDTAFRDIHRETSLETVKKKLIQEVQSVLTAYHTQQMTQLAGFKAEMSTFLSETQASYRAKVRELEEMMAEVNNTQKTATAVVYDLISTVESSGNLSQKLKKNEEMLKNIKEISMEMSRKAPIMKKKQGYLVEFVGLEYNEREQNVKVTVKSRKMYPITGVDLCLCLWDQKIDDWKYERVEEIRPGGTEVVIRKDREPTGNMYCFNGTEIGKATVSSPSPGHYTFLPALPDVILQRNIDKAETIKQRLAHFLTPAIQQELQSLIYTEDFDLTDTDTLISRLKAGQ